MNSNFIMKFNTERCFVSQNAEVMIVNESLIQDCGAGRLYARANFRNMSEKILKKLVVDVYCRDASGQVIGRLENCTYDNLNAVTDSSFGLNKPFEVNFTNTASVVFVVKEAKYDSVKPAKPKKEKKKRRKLWLIPCIILGVLLVLAAVLYFILIPIFAGDIVEKDIENGDYRSAYSTCITFENIGRAEAVEEAKYNCIEKWVDSIIAFDDIKEAEYFKKNVQLNETTYSSLCDKITNDVNAQIDEGNFRSAYNTCISFENISKEGAVAEVKADCIDKWTDSIIASGDKDEAKYFMSNVELSESNYSDLCNKVTNKVNDQIEEDDYRSAYNTFYIFESISKEDSVLEAKAVCVDKWVDSILSSFDSDEAKYFFDKVDSSELDYDVLHDKIINRINKNPYFNFWYSDKEKANAVFINNFMQHFPDDYEDIEMLEDFFSLVISENVISQSSLYFNNTELIDNLYDYDIRFASNIILNTANYYFGENEEFNEKRTNSLLKYSFIKRHISKSPDVELRPFMVGEWRSNNGYYLIFSRDENNKYYLKYSLPAEYEKYKSIYLFGTDLCFSDSGKNSEDDVDETTVEIELISYSEITLNFYGDEGKVKFYRK